MVLQLTLKQLLIYSNVIIRIAVIDNVLFLLLFDTFGQFEMNHSNVFHYITTLSGSKVTLGPGTGEWLHSRVDSFMSGQFAIFMK